MNNLLIRIYVRTIGIVAGIGLGLLLGGILGAAVGAFAQITICRLFGYNQVISTIVGALIIWCPIKVLHSIAEIKLRKEIGILIELNLSAFQRIFAGVLYGGFGGWVAILPLILSDINFGNTIDLDRQIDIAVVRSLIVAILAYLGAFLFSLQVPKLVKSITAEQKGILLLPCLGFLVGLFLLPVDFTVSQCGATATIVGGFFGGVLGGALSGIIARAWQE